MAKTKAPKDPIFVPFDKNGDLMHYAVVGRESYFGSPHFTRPNYEFDAMLKFDRVGRSGRSAVVAWWVHSESGKRYCMFLSDLDDLIRESGVVKGMAFATWTFCKKGSNYGVKRVKKPAAVPSDVAILAAVMMGGGIEASAAFVDRATESINGG